MHVTEIVENTPNVTEVILIQYYINERDLRKNFSMLI